MFRHLLLAAAVAAAFVATGTTSSLACDHCGCAAPCQKVCRLVCETKKVEITCWGCKCEEFCIPGPSKRGCKHCETVCADCDQAANPNGVCVQPKKFVWYEWIPGCCAKVQTRKKLMQKKITKEIPTYKWKVETLCATCCAQVESSPIPAGTELPPLPVGLGAATRILPVSFLSPE
jgi:hypothetical protein